MRDVGTVQRRLREDAASAGAQGGEQSPARQFPIRAIGFIPLTFIPLTFPLSFPSSPARNGWRPTRVILSEFESIRVNLTSRPQSGGAKNNFSYFHLISLNFSCFQFPASLPAVASHPNWPAFYVLCPPAKVGFAVQQLKIMQFQQDFNHKERKEHKDKNLWPFFFAIFVFFAVNSFLVAARRAANFAHFRGHSIQIPVHQQFTSKIGPF